MKKTIVSDIIAGLTVSFAALSLGAAFGIMSGRGAFAGMLGAAIIPIITSIFGGTRIQASGPTAPMTAITALIVAKAYDSFPGEAHLANEFITLVMLLSAVFIIAAGLLKLGRFITYVPQVVVLGFMNGIACLIWFDQLKKLFGLNGQTPLDGKMVLNIFIAFSCLGFIYLLPFLLKKLNVPANIRRFVPSIFVTIILATIVTSIFKVDVQKVSLGVGYQSFGDFLNVVMADFPSEREIFSKALLLAAIPLALQLCMLAYLDSLLTSLVIDKITGENTQPNKELFAQGLANGVIGLLQGVPGAQATIRSVLLIKEGAQTRLAGVLVGVFALIGFLFFGSLITTITSAVFIGVLLKAGLDVFDRDFAKAYFKNNWVKHRNRNIQAVFIIYTTVLTVVFDLNVAVISGTILFYIGKKYFNVVDAEDDFSEVKGDELHGQSLP
jgi:SulP family sulfate permease